MSIYVPSIPPPVLQRALLQPSVHARGVRGYAFHGTIDEWHAPGAITKNGVTRTAIDSAWLVERVLGPAFERPPIWPGVPAARERAIELGASKGLYGFQREGAAFLAERDYALLMDEMGCIEGGAEVAVRFNGQRTFQNMPLRELFARMIGNSGKPDIIVATEGEFTAHKIVGISSKGIRLVWRIQTERRSICATDDHEFQIFTGAWRPVRDLRVGERVRTISGVETITHMCEAGTTDVYDIVCAEPHRNFVANGFVVHNCGKTNQALIAAEARLSLGVIPSPTQPVVLIICPALAKRHWQREVLKWTGHEAVVLEGLAPDPEELTTRYVICNYDILYGQQKRDAAGVKHNVAHLPGWAGALAGRFLVAILDEAHAFRSIDSRRTKTTRSMLARTPVVWALTGTPIPNYVRDIYGLVELISGGLWGPSYWTWAKTYADAKQGTYGWMDKGATNTDQLRGRLSFFALGRSAKNVALELPEKRREIYKIDVKISAATVRQGAEAMSKTAFVAKALRATALAKRPAVIEQTLEALANKQKVIVFVYMREQAEEIGKAVKAKFDGPVTCVHGQLSPDGRDAAATAFREFSGAAAFVATIDSVNVAISLVGADLVLYGDLVPEPWKLLQSEKRAHRHGSTNRVLVRYLIATGTLDEGVAESVVEKLAGIEETMGSESEQQELSGMLGGGGRSDEEIVNGLFARLQGMAGGE